jgi:2-methylcitrate dehydratase PrpD
MERDGLTAAIARFASATAKSAVPDEAIGAAKRAFIDTVGVILAGRHEPAVTLVAGLLADGHEASAFAVERQLSAGDAALLNGVAGHVLDYDDVAQAGHPSVVLVPAILAAAERGNATGRDALAAYAIGFEVWSELARREPDAFHFGSWHPTSTLGIIAATAALSALAGLDARRSRNALAIAASLSSGVIANFGTPMKPYQAGRAAAEALEAVRLASAGMTGAADALEGAHGLLRGLSPKGCVDTQGDTDLGIGAWRLVTEGVSVKRYPVCYASHRAIDAAIALAKAHDLKPGEVRAVAARIGRAPAETLRYHDPRDGLEARFSLQHNIAAALVDRAVGFAQLDDGFVRRADVARLYPLTTIEVDETLPCPEQPGMAMHDHLVIETTGGGRLEGGPVRYAKGHARAPLGDGELTAKFLDCARHGRHRDPDGLLDRLLRLDKAETVGGLFA